MVKSWRKSKDRHNRPLPFGHRQLGTENYAPVGTRVNVRFDRMNRAWTQKYPGVVTNTDGDMRLVTLDKLHGVSDEVPKPIQGRDHVWVYYELVRPIVTLEDLPEIRIRTQKSEVPQNYTVVVIRDRLRKTEKKLLWSASVEEDERFEFRNILDEIWESLEGNTWEFDCLGGGRLRFDEKKRHIQIGGYVPMYKVEQNRRETITIFKQKFPGYRVEEVTPWM